MQNGADKGKVKGREQRASLTFPAWGLQCLQYHDQGRVTRLPTVFPSGRRTDECPGRDLSLSRESEPVPALPYQVEVSIRADDVVIAVDTQARVVFWNTVAERVLGLSQEEVLGRRLDEFCPLPGLNVKAVAHGGDFAGSVECRTSSGEPRMLYVYACGGRATAGRGRGVVIVAREVTGAWLVEEAMRSTEQRYRMLFEQSSDLVAIGTTSGQILEANETTVRVSGYSQAELRKMTMLDLVEPEDRPRAVAAMAEVSASGHARCTLSFRAKNGRRVVVELSVTRSAEGSRNEVLAIGRDITERSAVEAAVRESEARYRAIFEAVGDAVFVESLDGRILDVNENACRMFGYTRDELLSRQVADLVPDEARAWLPSVRAQLAAREVFRGEAVNVRKDGTRFPVEVSATSVDLAQGRMVVVVVRDISERHQARRALEESEQRYRSVFETTGAATVIIEEDTRVSLVNQEFERLSGYTREEVVGTSWTLYVHPEDVERMLEYHRARRSTPGTAPREYDFRLIDRGGRVRDCHLVIELVPGTGRSVASFLDVTEQRRTEQMLAESEERYRTLFRDVPVGIYRTTPDGRVLMANPYLARMLGLDEAEVLKLNLEKEGFGPRYQRSEFRAAVERGEVRGLESEWIRRDGTTIYVRENARAIRDESGNVLFYEGTVEDITERRAIERALEESEAHFRALAENAGDAILVAVGDGTHVYVNPRAVAMTGYESDELLAMRFQDLAHPDEVPMLEERYRRRQAGEAVPNSYRTAIKHRDGTRIEVELSASRISWHGKSGTLVIVRDVSQQMQLERALRAERDQLRSILDVVGVVVVALDRTGRVTLVNRSACELLGRAEADILGREWFRDFVPDHERAEVTRIFAGLLRGDVIRMARHESRVISAGGRLVTVHWRNTVLKDERGNIIGTLSSGAVPD